MQVFWHSVSSFPTPSSYTQCANSELRHSQHCKKKTIGNLLLRKDMFKILIIHTFIIVEELGFSNKTFAYSCLAADSVGRKTSQTSHKTQTNIPTILYDRQTMHLKYSQSDIYTFMRGISVRNLETFLVRRCVFCIKSCGCTKSSSSLDRMYVDAPFLFVPIYSCWRTPTDVPFPNLSLETWK